MFTLWAVDGLLASMLQPSRRRFRRATTVALACSPAPRWGRCTPWAAARRPGLLGLALGLALLCGGCQQGRPPVSLQLAISAGDGADAVARSSLKRLATQVANEYMRNHPEVLLHLRYLPDSDLVESVRARA